ncbi:hypothetical protein [Sideroxydans lithotrophicus]|uniref:Uncharacterized protein n=1 Tax=Sideroxydans lithotrophicus (strain ES-1) TaxID=580332 RepID=D5CQY0_SIDLE|nr:hypothetical protein [Sideroxydans lithotrophicus]ADE11366.1 hypothetical protein Slit_1128 [Sideroxydans lithotrophicus ES-1]
MDKQNKESALAKYLPSSRQVMIHFAIMFAFSCVLGPLIGPWLTNWINPPLAWGSTTRIGDYSMTSTLLWGFSFLMFEIFFYTGWLFTRAKKGWEEAQPKSWYN